jgi:RimJ/RimL family protein N-acetyltransferase
VQAGVTTVRALIDDENQPSIALHERAGLTRSEGPFWTYRLVL